MDKCIRKYVGEGHLHLLHLCFVEVMTVLDGMHDVGTLEPLYGKRSTNDKWWKDRMHVPRMDFTLIIMASAVVGPLRLKYLFNINNRHVILRLNSHNFRMKDGILNNYQTYQVNHHKNTHHQRGFPDPRKDSNLKLMTQAISSRLSGEKLINFHRNHCFSKEPITKRAGPTTTVKQLSMRNMNGYLVKLDAP